MHLLQVVGQVRNDYAAAGCAVSLQTLSTTLCLLNEHVDDTSMTAMCGMQRGEGCQHAQLRQVEGRSQ